jgi:hypothetical protein
MRTTILLVSLMVSLTTADSPQRTLSFADGWQLTGEKTRVGTDGDRQVLDIETGQAHRRDISFTDGTIDLDVQLSDRRSFVYVSFRVDADGDREEFYLRPHKSSLPDAVQYAPVWQGRSAWQLHHGRGATAAVAFVPGQWTHVRVVVKGRQAAIFIGDLTTPALVVHRLAREPRAGHIGLGGFVPVGTPGTAPAARFANVRVSPEVTFDLDAAANAEAQQPGMGDGQVIRTWSVSPAFVPETASTAAPTIPSVAADGRFTRMDTEADGLLSLHRHVKVAPNSRVTAAVARTTVRAARAGVYALDLGFSDIATVFVNGTPVFTGDASYSFDRPRREGLIGYDQARLYLALQEGENELAVSVSDSFGGWGLMARFVGATGLTIAAAR